MTPGTRIGPYEVLAKIGAGGLGDVYRARDTRLKRDVALKILPEQFTTDPDRLARFEREAEVLASLNHPHIAHIHGFEESPSTSSGQAGIRALVMELVEGETLADWIVRQSRSAPIDEVVAIARQIAEALEAAHDHGVIHRDLKPANIKVAEDGTVKVLDFGLARAGGSGETERGDPANSPTMTTPANMTRAGVILGTAAYMAPEQAKGRTVDKRADIWAFGCVLFEMLTGRSAFERETLTETLAAVVRDAPPLDLLPGRTPPHVRRLLARCLERDPRRRLRDIGEARLALEGSSIESDVPAAVGREGSRRPRWAPALPWGVAVALAAALAFTLVRPTPPASPPLSQFIVPLPEPIVESGRPVIALSPDGERLAFVAQHDGSSAIYLRDVDGFDAKPLAGTENATTLFFSPDGEWIGFYTSGRIRKVSVRGGPPVTLATTTDQMGATWSRSGTIISTTGSAGLIAIPENGGESRTIGGSSETPLDKMAPHALPDGRTILYVGQQGEGRPRSVYARRLDSDREQLVVSDATQPAYFDGHLLFARSGTVFASRFDVERLEVSGAPTPVLEGVLFNAAFASTQYTISSTGRLAYVPAAVAAARQLSVIDRSGAVSAITDVRGRFYVPRVSPDGRRIAVTVGTDEHYRLATVDVATGALAHLVDAGMAGVWSPDGRRLVFATPGSGRTTLQIVSMDGSSATIPVLTDPSIKVPTSWSPDGRWIAFTRVQEGSGTGEDVFVVAPDGSGLRPLIQTSANEHAAVFSPDGRWLAHAADRAGDGSAQRVVFVSSVDNPSRRWRVDTGGGFMPVWSRDGRELVFLSGQQADRLMAAAMTVRSDGIDIARPTLVAEVRMGTSIGFGQQRYDVMPDGRRFVFPSADVAAPPTQIRIVLDFGSQLATLVAR